MELPKSSVLIVSLAVLMSGCVAKSTHDQTVEQLEVTTKKLQAIEAQLSEAKQDIDVLRVDHDKLEVALAGYRAAERRMYERINAENMPVAEQQRVLREYLAFFPEGGFAADARTRLEQLESGTSAKAVRVPSAVTTAERSALHARIRQGQRLSEADWTNALVGLTFNDLVNLLGGAARVERTADGASLWVYQTVKVAREDGSIGWLGVTVRNGTTDAVSVHGR